MNWRGWLLLSVAGIVFSAAVIVATVTRHDRGMIAVGKCAALSWPADRLPLFVETNDIALARASTGAVEWWDARLLRAFVFSGVDGEAASNGTIIAIRFTDALQGHARPRFNDLCQILSVEVDIPLSTPASELDRVVTHELGHALGLADDTSPESSVMFHHAMSGAFELTDGDAALLRRFYGGEQ